LLCEGALLPFAHDVNVRRAHCGRHAERQGRGVQGGGIPPARDKTAWLAVDRKLEHPQVLILNMTHDTVFPPDGTLAFFAVIPGHERLVFWEGGHVGRPANSIRQSVEFLGWYAA
jgi:hypothetical protein